MGIVVRRRMAWWVLIGLAAGMATWQIRSIEPDAPPAPPAPPASLEPAEPLPQQDSSGPMLTAEGTKAAPEEDGNRFHVRGRIVTQDGTPMPGLLVRVNGAQLEPRPCDEEGYFELLDLGIGRHLLMPVEPNGRKVADAHELMIEAGRTTYDVTLLVPRAYPTKGRVVDARGDPVPALHLAFVTEGDDHWKGRAETDGEGNFRLNLWEPGPFLAIHGEERLRGICTAGATDNTLVYEGTRRHSLLVRIVDPEGAPVPRCTLTVSTGDKNSRSGGVYQVKDGLWRLYPDSWGTHTDLKVEWPTDADGNRLPLAGKAVAAPDPKAHELEIVLPEGRTVQGIVLDDTDAPIPDMKIDAFDAGVPTQPVVLGHLTSDEDGRFVLRGVPPSTVFIDARVRNTAWPAFTRAYVEPGETQVVVRVHGGTRFEVKVTDLVDGKPIAGVHVTASWLHKGHWGQEAAETDVDGRAALPSVPREARLTVKTQTFNSKARYPQSEATDVDSGLGRLHVRLPRGLALAGHVLDADGKPVHAGTVLAIAPEPRPVGHADMARPDPKTGAFRFERLTAGTYDVWFQPEKLSVANSKPLRIEIPSDAIEIRTGRLTSVQGTLLVDDPQLWTIQWRAKPSGANGRVQTNGRFQLFHIRDDVGHLIATQDGDERIVVLENVRPGDGPFELKPTRGLWITGRVTGVGRTPDIETWIHARRGDLVLQGNVLGPDGFFRVGPLPSGVWTLEVSRHGKRVHTSEPIAAGSVDVKLDVPKAR